MIYFVHKFMDLIFYLLNIKSYYIIKETTNLIDI